MQTISKKTVGEIAAANPASAQVFERLGIDYCCGGNHSLSIACARANVPVERVAQLLEQPAGEEQPAVREDAPLGELTRHIVQRHHTFIREESPRIQELLVKVCAKHGPAHPELSRLKALFETLVSELMQHLMKEECILFPYIEALHAGALPRMCFASVESPIAVMTAEHESAGEILSGMRALADGYRPPAEACASFQALYRALEEFECDLHWHVHLENNILFPRAIALEQQIRRSAILGME
jgi:regulator of cell morphogenesis and NO signaling